MFALGTPALFVPRPLSRPPATPVTSANLTFPGGGGACASPELNPAHSMTAFGGCARAAYGFTPPKRMKDVASASALVAIRCDHGRSDTRIPSIGQRTSCGLSGLQAAWRHAYRWWRAPIRGWPTTSALSFGLAVAARIDGVLLPSPRCVLSSW